MHLPGETTGITFLQASTSTEVTGDGTIKPEDPATSIVNPISYPDISVEAVDLSFEVYAPGPALPSLEDETSIDSMVGWDALPFFDTTAQPEQPSSPAQDSVSITADLSGFFDSLLLDVLSVDMVELVPLDNNTSGSQETSVSVALAEPVEDLPNSASPTIETPDSNAALSPETLDSVVLADASISSPELSVAVHDSAREISATSPTLEACNDLNFSDVSDEVPHLTLDMNQYDKEVTSLATSIPRDTERDDIDEREQPPTLAITTTDLSVAILDTELVQPLDLEPTCIDQVAHETVECLELTVAVTKSSDSSLVPLADNDDEPLEPPPEVPTRTILIVSEFVVRYICMVCVRSEIPRFPPLYTFRPMVSEFEEVALRRTTRVFVEDVQWGQQRVKEIRRLTFKMARTAMEVSVEIQDSREASCLTGFALVARNSLPIEMQRLSKFLRWVVLHLSPS